MSDCICLGACFGPNGTPDTWAELVAAERVLTDNLVTAVINDYGDDPQFEETHAALAAVRKARQQ